MEKETPISEVMRLRAEISLRMEISYSINRMMFPDLEEVLMKIRDMGY